MAKMMGVVFALLSCGSQGLTLGSTTMSQRQNLMNMMHENHASNMIDTSTVRTPRVPRTDSLYDLDGSDYAVKKKDLVLSRVPDSPDKFILLKNRNLVFYGDSNDRNAMHYLCNMMHGSAVVYIENHHVCTADKYNSTLLYVGHAGAMSTKHDEGNWHKMALESRNPPFGMKHIDPVWQQMQDHSLKKFVDALPARPAILVVQSSLWDSVLGAEFLTKYKRPLVMSQHILETPGWKANEDGIQAWDWDQRATELLEQATSEGNFEKIIWRTNSNCPMTLSMKEELIDVITEQQARVARGKVEDREGPWQNAFLMDWRADLDARSKNWCQGVHYTDEGYDSFAKVLLATITKAFGL